MHDFLVIGGGVIGMTTARELALNGFSVALFDKGELGREASWAAGGILSSMRPWVEHPASAALSNAGKRDYQAFTESLKADTGIDPEYIKCGLFMAGKDDIKHTLDWARQNAVNWSQGKAQIPQSLVLHDDTILLPDIAQVRPSRLVRALAADLRARKVDVFEHMPVSGMSISNGRFHSVTAGNDEFPAGAAIVCAGAWSATLLQQLGIAIDVKPVCGQMLCMHLPGMRLKQIVLDGGHYLIPRADDHFLVGSSMEHTGFRKDTTAETRQKLLEWAHKMWPDSREAVLVDHWAGLRPGSDAGHPYIGKIPGLDGIYFNTAHFRKGVLQAVPSARLLLDYLLKKQSFTDIEAYQPKSETQK